MYELMGPLAPLYGEVGNAFPGQNSRSRFGQDGNAQLADGLQMEDVGDAGERENLDEVVRGGEGSDFKGIMIGFIQVNRGDGVKEMEDVGDDDISVMLWTGDNMVRGLVDEDGWTGGDMKVINDPGLFLSGGADCFQDKDQGLKRERGAFYR